MFRNDHHDSSLLPEWLSLTLIILLIVYVALRIARGSMAQLAYSSWTHLIDNYSYSAVDFYEKLMNNIHATKVPGVKMKSIEFSQGTAFISPNRLYLEVRWQEKLFYVCAAPYGRGFFISWWLFEQQAGWEPFVYALPGGKWIVQAIKPITFYRIDTARVFQRYMHDTIMATMEEITKGTGTRLDNVEKPTMYDPFNRK